MTSRDKVFRLALRDFDPFEAALRKQWAIFKEQNRLDMELEMGLFATQPIYEALFEQEGLKNGAWDVALVNTDWLAQIYEMNAALDLAPLLKSNPPEGYPEGWMPSLLRLQQFGESVVGMPFHDGPECLVYRKDLFEDPAIQLAYQQQFNQPLALPETWDDFYRLAKFFTNPPKNLYGTVFASYPDRHNTVYDFCLQIWTRGGEIYDGKRVLFDTPAAAETLTFYRAILNDPSASHPSCREFDSVKSGMAFARGEVALMVNWFGFAAMSETLADSKVKDKVAIGKVPRGVQGSSASLNVYWLLSIGAGSPHQTLAYEFLRHCATPEMDKIVTEVGAIGVRRSTWHDAEINAAIPFYHELENIHQFARELPRLSQWDEVGRIIDEVIIAAIDTNRPIAEILAEAQSKSDRLF